MYFFLKYKFNDFTMEFLRLISLISVELVIQSQDA